MILQRWLGSVVKSRIGRLRSELVEGFEAELV